ncbi:hypothetical protein EG328_005883 [Venturia inaequalis]|uniref:Uncharacterized protein n=1 Tax=Venturia inaequalis TaxID=5025 RepID=A0A8H3Z562_VENIN|nr:hypothetical protein EG328_005883 [Venturia inaequalis]
MASTHASKIAASKARGNELKILVQRRDTIIASKNEQYAIELKSLTEKVALVATRDLTIKKIEAELAKSRSLMKQLLEGTARLKRERDDQRTEMANLASQIDVLDRQAAEAESENKKALFKLEEISELEDEQQVETNNIYIGKIEAQRGIIDFLAARLGVEIVEIETEAEEAEAGL